MPDPSHVLEMDEVQIKDNLSFEAQPVIIEDQQIKQFRGKVISMVKLLWDAWSGVSTQELEEIVRESIFTSLLVTQFSRTKIFAIGDNCKAQ